MKKNTIIISVITLVLAAFVMFTMAYEEIPATPKECQDNVTMAKAVVDRDLSWNQFLVCEGPVFSLEN